MRNSLLRHLKATGITPALKSTDQEKYRNSTYQKDLQSTFAFVFQKSVAIIVALAKFFENPKDFVFEVTAISVAVMGTII